MHFFLREEKEMKTAKMILSILWICFLLGCAASQSVQRGPDDIAAQRESSEASGPLLGRLKALEDLSPAFALRWPICNTA